jgi:hypothetical protein
MTVTQAGCRTVAGSLTSPATLDARVIRAFSGCLFRCPVARESGVG